MLPPKKRVKHVVVLGKQHIIGVDGIKDVEAYNNYDEMSLFIDFTKKIGVLEKNLPKDILPWERKGVMGKVVTMGA
jgi:phage anti-repressor protein